MWRGRRTSLRGRRLRVNARPSWLTKTPTRRIDDADAAEERGCACIGPAAPQGHCDESGGQLGELGFLAMRVGRAVLRDEASARPTLLTLRARVSWRADSQPTHTGGPRAAPRRALGELGAPARSRHGPRRGHRNPRPRGLPSPRRHLSRRAARGPSPEASRLDPRKDEQPR